MTQLAASDITVGTVLRDTYEITSMLGKGGMGAVFLARHRRLPGKQVAVKVLLHGANLNPDLYARFRREAEVTSQLGHPHIVEVSDFDTLQDGTPFLVMEYLRGESLEQRLDRGRLPLATVLTLTRQMGSALQAAHRAGVVHRDLKPANVFLVPTDVEGVMGDRVKLLDFGISKMLDSSTLQTQEAVLIGTPQYMAPEQAMGKNSEVGPATDLFALGCIVYEMLSGRAPFAGEGSSLVQVVFRIVHAQPEPLSGLCPDVPSHIIAAVERALSKNVQDRHPDVSAFIADLTGQPLQAPSGAAPVLTRSRNAIPAVNTGNFGAPSSAGAEDDLGATYLPSSTARIGVPSGAGAEDDLGATYLPSSTAQYGAPAAGVAPQAGPSPTSTAQYGAPVARAADDGLGATHMPAPAVRLGSASALDSRFPNPAAQVEPDPVAVRPPTASLGGAPSALAVAPSSVPAAPTPAAPPVTVLPPEPLARANPQRGLLAALAVLVVLVGAASVWRWTRVPPPSAPVVAPVPIPMAGPSATPPPVATRPPEPKPPEPAPTPPPDPVAIATPTAPQPTSKPSTRNVPSSPSAPVSKEAQDVLKEAERALDVGNLDEAIRLARRSQQFGITGTSFSVMTRAYCQRHDLSMARSNWRAGTSSESKAPMSTRERTAVKKYCATYGYEF